MHKTLNILHTTGKRLLLGIISAFCLSLLISNLNIYAESPSENDDNTLYEYTNQTTGYEALIRDDANLLSTHEKESIFTFIQPITEYGHVAFHSTNHNSSDTDDYAEDYYQNHFGSESGTIFLIDMDNRMIYIHSNGYIYRTITKSIANTITDNVYSYASDEDYYQCAYQTFSQILTKMEGGKIAQPMKYTSNVFLAILLALLFNYLLVQLTSKAKRAQDRELLNNLVMHCDITDGRSTFSHQTRRYDPPSSSSGGRGGGGGHGGGGGGGGGGHSF